MLNLPSDTVDRVVAVGIAPHVGIVAREDGVLKAWPVHRHPDLEANLSRLPRLPNVQAVAIAGDRIVVVRQDGTPLALDRSGIELSEQPAFRDLRTVVGAAGHFVGLRRDGTAVCWGDDTLSHSTPGIPSGISAVATSGSRCILLTQEGRLLDWGNSRLVPLGFVDPKEEFMAVAISDEATFAVRRDGTVAAWGSRLQVDGQIPPPGLQGIVGISTSGYHVVALRADTTIVTWGSPFLQAPVDLSGVHTVVAGTGFSLTLGVPQTPEILDQPDPVTVLGWEKAQLTAQVRGYALQMQWRKDGQIVPGATNSTLVIPPPVVARAAGDYVLEVRNPAGVVTSEPATLSVRSGEPPGGAIVWGVGTEYLSADNPHEFVAVAANDLAFLLLRSDGRVFQCGTWPDARPVAVEWLSSVKAIARSVNHDVALLENGVVTKWGAFGPPETIPDLRGAMTIAAGLNSTFGIMADGRLVADRASLPSGLGPVRSVGVWLDLAAAVQTNGELVVWGQGDAANHRWIREAPKTTNALAAVLGGQGGLVLLSDGTVLGWPDHSRVPRDLAGVVQLAAGFNHEIALRRDGTVVAFGDNQEGQIAVPSGLSWVTGIAAGDRFSVAIGRPRIAPEVRGTHALSPPSPGSTARLSVDASGFGLSFQWRRDGVDIPGATQSEYLVENIQADASGSYSVLVCNPAGCETVDVGPIRVADKLAPGTAVSWGPGQRSEHYPYVGSETVPEGVVGATAIAAEGNAAIAVLNDGTVRAWGGDMSPAQRALPTDLNGVVMADASRSHFVAVRADGTVLCWGRELEGECQLPTDLGPVAEVAAGRQLTAALRRDGVVEVWGRLRARLEVPGPVQSVRAYGDQLAVLLSDGVVMTGRDWRMAPIMSNMTAIAVGGSHVLGLSADGKVHAWNSGASSLDFGQSVVPQDLQHVIAIAAGEFYSMALKADGMIVTWGQILDWGDRTLKSPAPPANFPAAFAIAACDATGYALIGDRPEIPLRIHLEGMRLKVLWPISAGPQVLRSAGSLETSIWTPWAGEPIADDGWTGIQGPTAAGTGYFRLGHPN